MMATPRAGLLKTVEAATGLAKGEYPAAVVQKDEHASAAAVTTTNIVHPRPRMAPPQPPRGVRKRPPVEVLELGSSSGVVLSMTASASAKNNAVASSTPSTLAQSASGTAFTAPAAGKNGAHKQQPRKFEKYVEKTVDLQKAAKSLDIYGLSPHYFIDQKKYDAAVERAKKASQVDRVNGRDLAPHTADLLRLNTDRGSSTLDTYVVIVTRRKVLDAEAKAAAKQVTPAFNRTGTGIQIVEAEPWTTRLFKFICCHSEKEETNARDYQFMPDGDAPSIKRPPNL